MSCRASIFGARQSFEREHARRSLLFDLDMSINRPTGALPTHAALVSLAGVCQNWCGAAPSRRPATRRAGTHR